MREYIEERTKEYMLPVAVAAYSENVKGAKILLDSPMPQGIIGFGRKCVSEGKGYIILDFGKEYFGGVRILFGTNKCEGDAPNIRIRFGESLTECCAELGEKNATNDHSTRDFSVYMSSNSDMEWGSTGYRFIRIDFLREGVYSLLKIYGTFLHGEPPKGSFECDDEIVNRIYETAAHTIWLNMQNGCIWDGIKRDQHIWAGDLYPEVLAALYLYGDCAAVYNSLERIVDYYPLPCWYNDIPTYSVWFILVSCMYFEKIGRSVDKFVGVFSGILRQLEEIITDDGNIDYKRSRLSYWEPLFDWPSFGSEDSERGCEYLIRYTLQTLAACETVTDKEVRRQARGLLQKLKAGSDNPAAFKAITAFGSLCGKISPASAVASLKEGGARGYSTFLSYFIARALASNGETKAAFEAMRDYYGGMLKMGASTFWESFDVDWMNDACTISQFPEKGQKDIHGDFGVNCYVGFRHSLCHGWSCGVIPFLIEYVVGFSFADALCSEVRFRPNLCGLKYVRCTIPTAKGDISAEIYEKDGKIEKSVICPPGVRCIE